jgi:hypothetical protein
LITDERFKTSARQTEFVQNKKAWRFRQEIVLMELFGRLKVIM